MPYKDKEKQRIYMRDYQRKWQKGRRIQQKKRLQFLKNRVGFLEMEVERLQKQNMQEVHL